MPRKHVFKHFTPVFPLDHIMQVVATDTGTHLYIQGELIAKIDSPDNLKSTLVAFIANNPPQIRACRDPQYCRLVHYDGRYGAKTPLAQKPWMDATSHNEQQELLRQIKQGLFDTYFSRLVYGEWEKQYQEQKQVEDFDV